MCSHLNRLHLLTNVAVRAWYLPFLLLLGWTFLLEVAKTKKKEDPDCEDPKAS